MRRNLYSLGLVLLLSAVFAFAQTPGQSQTSPASGQNPPAASTPPTFPEGQQAPAQNPSQPTATPDQNQTSKSATASNDDQSLIEQVKGQLASNPDLTNVQVDAKNGKVTLNGSVPKKEDRQKARELARSVPGVKSVRDHLTVNASFRSSAANSGASSSSQSSMPQSDQSAANVSNPSANTSSSTTSSATGEGPELEPACHQRIGKQPDGRAAQQPVQPAAVGPVSRDQPVKHFAVSRRLG